MAIVMLVVFHCFEPHIGDCRLPEAHQFIAAYRWIAEAAYACMLELFVFVSGYVLAFSRQRKPQGFSGLVRAKAKRLLAPYLLFGILYFILFYGFEGRSIWQSAYIILNGPGHLWFLLMLFEVMIAAYLLEQSKMDSRQKWLIVCTLPVMAFIPIPLRIGQSFYYLPLFYLGMQTYKRSDYLIDRFARSGLPSALLLLTGAVIFVSGTWLIDGRLQPIISDTANPILLRSAYAIAKRLLHLAWSVALVGGLYLLVNRLLRKTDYTARHWLIELNSLCLGAYVFHMFVIRWLYYYTELPTVAGPYWLPWIGAGVALPTALFFSWLLRLSEAGRRII